MVGDLGAGSFLRTGLGERSPNTTPHHMCTPHNTTPHQLHHTNHTNHTRCNRTEGVAPWGEGGTGGSELRAKGIKGRPVDLFHLILNFNLHFQYVSSLFLSSESDASLKLPLTNSSSFCTPFHPYVGAAHLGEAQAVPQVGGVGRPRQGHRRHVLLQRRGRLIRPTAHPRTEVRINITTNPVWEFYTNPEPFEEISANSVEKNFTLSQVFGPANQQDGQLNTFASREGRGENLR